MSFKLISTVLSRVHASVTHAPDGKAAIELCRANHPFDLVIMDIHLPEMDGIEATRQIKQSRPSLPVIAATASKYDDEMDACREAGCDGFITKPLQFGELFRMMQVLFER